MTTTLYRGSTDDESDGHSSPEGMWYTDDETHAEYFGTPHVYRLTVSDDSVLTASKDDIEEYADSDLSFYTEADLATLLGDYMDHMWDLRGHSFEILVLTDWEGGGSCYYIPDDSFLTLIG